MKSKSAVPLLMLLVLGAIFGYSGCTAIGYGIGSAIDSHKQDYDTIPGWRAAGVERGKNIALTTRNGEELKGEYLGLDTVTTSQYARWYNDNREKYQKEVPLPALGDSIIFSILKPAREYKGEFLGFDNQCICVRLLGAFRKYNMNYLERISDKNGNLIELQKLKNLSSEGKIPALSAVMVRTAVMVKTNVDTIRVPTATVSQIEIPSDKNAKWIGLVIGAVVDVAIVAVSNMNRDGNWNWNLVPRSMWP
jgi:hypothetical protein